MKGFFNTKKENSRTKNSFLNLLTGFAGQTLSILLGFAVRTIFIQTLGVNYLGIGGLFSNILQLLSLTQLGVDAAINFRLYKPLAEKDEKRVRVLMKFYKHVYWIIGGIIFLLGMALIPTLPYLIKDYDNLRLLRIDAVGVFLLYLLQSVSTYVFFAYWTSLVQTAQKSYIINIIDYFVKIAQSVAQIIVLLWLENFMVFVATVVVFNLIRNAINAIIAKRLFAYAFESTHDRISTTEVIDILKDTLALFVYKINSVVLKGTDNIVLSSFVGLTIVGLYANYYLFYIAIQNLLSQIYSSIKASYGNLFTTQSIERSYFMFETLTFLTVLLYGTAMVGLTICSDEFVYLWIGEEFVIPQPFSLLIGIELLIYGLKLNLNLVRNTTGAFKQMWYRPLISIVVNIIISIALVQYIGICGVIIGTIAADLVNLMIDPKVIHKYVFKNIKSEMYYYRRLIEYLLIIVILTILLQSICHYISTGSEFIDLGLHILVCLIGVPLSFVTLYWKTDICKYLTKKVLKR